MAENTLEKKIEFFQCFKDISPSRELITIPGTELPKIKVDIYFLNKDYQKSIDKEDSIKRFIDKRLSIKRFINKHLEFSNQEPVDRFSEEYLSEEYLKDYAISVIDSFFDVIMAKFCTDQESLTQLILLPLTYKSCLLQAHGTYDKQGKWAVNVENKHIPVLELTKELFDEGYKAIYLKICNPLNHTFPSSGGDKFVIYPQGDFGLTADFGIDVK